MGLIIDVIIVLFVVLSTFLGYKKGLISLGIQLIACIVSLIISLILYKPIGNLVVNSTPLDEKLQDIIQVNLENFTSEDDNGKQTNNALVEYAKQGMLPDVARSLAINIIYVVTMLILFVISRICFLLIGSLANDISKLPIIKQFNKIGGILYGLFRGMIIIYAILMIINLIIMLNPKGYLNEAISQSYLAKAIITYNLTDIFS